MFPYTQSKPSAATVETQLALFGDLSKLLTGSFMKLWEANLAFSEAMFAGVWQTARAAQPGNGPRQAADTPAQPGTNWAYGQQLAGIAADLQDGMSRIAADHFPGLAQAQRDVVAQSADALRAAADESGLDAAGEAMHAEGHVQSSATANAPPLVQPNAGQDKPKRGE